MKITKILFSVLILTTLIFSQEYIGMTNIELQKNIEFIDNLPKYNFDNKRRNRNLPNSVDNSKSKFFRPIFNQVGGCCSQASIIAYHYTYLYNQIFNSSASLTENQFPTHYTYNFSNNGDSNKGSSFEDGIDLINDNGIPTSEVYGATSPNANYWMSGYENYFKSISCKTRPIESWSIILDSLSSLNNLKSWLYDMDGKQKPGGLASFSVNFKDRITQTMKNGAKAGEEIITKWAGIGHSITIVGYNDSICFDLNNDGKYTRDIDINSDNIIDFKDSEWGAFKIANSWGNWFEDEGFTYAPYSLISKVCILNIPDTLYKPKGVVELSYSCKDRYSTKILRGVSRLGNHPEFIEQLRTFDGSRAGHFPLSGVKPSLQIGIDVSNQIDYNFNSNDIFIHIGIVSDSINGTIENALFHDYRMDNEETITPTSLPSTFSAGTTWVVFKIENKKAINLIDIDTIYSNSIDTTTTQVIVSGEHNYNNWYIDSLSYCECEADSIIPNPNNVNLSFEVWDFPAQLSLNDTFVNYYGNEFTEITLQNRGRGGIRFGTKKPEDTIAIAEWGEKMLKDRDVLSILDAIVTVQWDRCYYKYIGNYSKPEAIELKWHSKYLNLYSPNVGFTENCDITVRARINTSGKFEFYYDQGNTYNQSSPDLPYTVNTTIGISNGNGNWQRHPIYSLDQLLEHTENDMYSFAYEPAKIPEFCKISNSGKLQTYSPINGEYTIPIAAANSIGEKIRKCIPLIVSENTPISTKHKLRAPLKINFFKDNIIISGLDNIGKNSLEFNMYSLNGKKVFKINKKLVGSSVKFPIPSQLSSGIYLCNVKNSNRDRTFKIQIQ